MNLTGDEPGLSFALKGFAQLELQELYDILHLRDVVFVVGQQITAEPEVDGLDQQCSHALVREVDSGRLVGTLRVFTRRYPLVVGRVAVHPERQRGGVGTWMMRRLQERLGARHADLHAQSHLEDWYRRLGWERQGEEFMEAEIPHVTMVYRPAPRD